MPRRRGEAGKATSGVDQTVADADQTAADADQTSADTDQSASDRDQAQADADQRASDRDQAASDRDLRADPAPGATRRQTYERSREARGEATLDRMTRRTVRAQVASERYEQAKQRDLSARRRDLIAEERDREAEERDREADKLAHRLGAGPRATAALEAAVRAEAALARARAAVDRERAARDREAAAHDREELLVEVERSHFDDLTGAYRRGIGGVVLRRELENARHSGSGLALACVDVEGLADINDRDGQAAGDVLLGDVFATLQSSLRPFDPIVRWSAGRFVCAVYGVSLADAGRRLDAAAAVVAKAQAGASISVGLAELADDDTLDTLVDRAEAAARDPRQPGQ